MKDNFLLLISALFVSFLAWLFWAYVGENGFAILSSIALIALFTDNFRLRQKLKANK